MAVQAYSPVPPDFHFSDTHSYIQRNLNALMRHWLRLAGDWYLNYCNYINIL